MISFHKVLWKDAPADLSQAGWGEVCKFALILLEGMSYGIEFTRKELY